MNRDEMTALASLEPLNEKDKCHSRLIGSDEDFRDRALEREKWEAMEARERQANTSVKRGNLMREGFHAGFESAASDFTNGTANVEHFEGLREQRNAADFYAIGFELGYLRKLAEILVA